MCVLLKLSILFPFFLCSVKCANILMAQPIPSYSHFILGFNLAKGLLERGHQITMLSPFPQKNAMENYTDLPLIEIMQIGDEMKKILFEVGDNPLASGQLLMDTMMKMTECLFTEKSAQDLMKSNAKFDLVILTHAANDVHIGLGQHFKAPVILLETMAPSVLNKFFFGNPLGIPYVPCPVGVHHFTNPMTFVERLLNFFDYSMMILSRALYVLPKQREMFKKYFKTDLELDDVLYNVSLMLTNSHISINGVAPLLPAIIEVGGFHVAPPKKLPEELQTLFDNAKDGVIIFSMGSNLKSKDLNGDVRDAILRAFAKINQLVLWKFETDLPNKPKNVVIRDWLPQQDVLAHPNVRAFISHGGLLSTVETIYHGVPVIGIPVFGDQKGNIAKAVDNGYALSIPLKDLNEQRLSTALDEILNNPKYRNEAQRRSRILHDQPLNPLETAIFWVEHVIRYKGATHFRSPGLDLKWYQMEMLDIFAFLALVTIVTFTTFYIIIKRILRAFRIRRAKKVTQYRKNK